ncbi:MAG: zf-HC2 domain-containing protein [Armatimonadetes bacterium]|nr:zf-HC2 domain-containing protein [Armatimonadota bacterium]
MNCKLAQAELDDVLDGKEAIQTRRHLLECADCRGLLGRRRLLRRLQAHAALLGPAVQPHELPRTSRGPAQI